MKYQDYLAEHTINEESVKKFELTGDNVKLNIPIKDTNGNLCFTKQRYFTGNQKFFIPKGTKTILFNTSILNTNPQDLFITGGEIDCIRLDQEGLAAVSGTAGEGTFKKEWIDQIAGISRIFLCLDNDKTGIKKTEDRFKDFPEARAVEFPIGIKDICEYFKNHNKSDFIELVKQSLSEEEFLAKHHKENNQDKSTPAKDGNVTYSLDAPSTVDVLDQGDKLVYLTKDLDIAETITVDGQVYAPPPKDSIPYLIPEADKLLHYLAEYKDNPQHCLELYEELVAYHKSISDLPDDAYYDLLALWDFHTYLLDKLHFSPIIYLYAVKERGKSRTGKGCIYVSRRGVWTETVREADIIRWGNDHKAVLGFDVKDAPKKFQRANCDDLILARFEKGSSSSRTLWPDKGPFRDTKTFNLFGPTIIATNRPVDDILESRAISVDMKPTSKVFNNPVTPEAAFELKCKLVAFRTLHSNDKLVEADKPASGRLGDILSPLYRIALTYFPDKKEQFFKLLKIVEARKKDDATETLEAKILETVINLEDQVESGFLAVEIITKKFNEGKDDRFALKEDAIGKILRGLGFENKRTAKKRGIYYDLDLLEKLKLNYGLNDTNDTSDTETDTPSNTNDAQTSESDDIPETASQESQASLNHKTIGEMTSDEQLALGKSVFGEGTHWADETEGGQT